MRPSRKPAGVEGEGGRGGPSNDRRLFEQLAASFAVEARLWHCSPSTVISQAHTSGPRQTLRCTSRLALRNEIQELSHIKGDIAFEDESALIGDLTVEETLTTCLSLRRGSLTAEQRKARVEEVMRALGLYEARDTIIGTVLRRGLSGGQSRRVSLGREMLQPSALLMLDEPTSGLDATTAYSFLAFLRSELQASKGERGALITLQQPNRRLLDLVDNLMILGPGGVSTVCGPCTQFGGEERLLWAVSTARRTLVVPRPFSRPHPHRPLPLPPPTLPPSPGTTLFFGTTDEAAVHFASMGIVAEPDVSPADLYLRATSAHEAEEEGGRGPAAFAAAFADSDVGRRHDTEVRRYLRPSKVEPSRSTRYLSSFGQQYAALLYRGSLVARRDYTLFFFQLLVHLQFGFMVGAVFWMSSFSVGFSTEAPFSAIAWLLIISAFIQIFKAHFLVISNARFRHEHANHMYSILPFWLAEITLNVVCSSIFVPGVVIGYFMAGLPAGGVGVAILVAYLVGLTMEAALHVITLFTSSAAYSVVVALIVTMFFSTYTTGSFIRPDIIPEGWQWFQDLSMFYPASRSMLWYIMGLKSFECANDGASTYLPLNGVCLYTGVALPCDGGVRNGTCFVEGRTVVELYKGYDSDDDTWRALGELVGIALGFRFLVLFFYYFSPQWLLSQARFFLRSCCGSGRGEGSDNQGDAAKLAATPVDTLADSHRVVIPGAPRNQQQGPTLVWKDLRVVVHKWRSSKMLISGLSGSAVGGRLLTVMGASGAGKTTMLNALCGRASYAKVTGTVLLDGQPFTRTDLNYVPQFDEFSPSLTVHENFVYASRLYQPSDEDDGHCRARVEEILEAMNLDHRLDQLPQALTSGEQKRVSVGLGLVARPRVIFLDEPTTVC